MSLQFLIVDHDRRHAKSIIAGLGECGYKALAVDSAAEACEVAKVSKPEVAVVNLRLLGESGLDCMESLMTLDPEIRVVIFTGFPSLTSATEAIRRGAVEYLTKPFGSEDIRNALVTRPIDTNLPDRLTPHNALKLQEWERINRELIETCFNVSKAARNLGMHRRTLTRKLSRSGIVI